MEGTCIYSYVLINMEKKNETSQFEKTNSQQELQKIKLDCEETELIPNNSFVRRFSFPKMNSNLQSPIQQAPKTGTELSLVKAGAEPIEQTQVYEPLCMPRANLLEECRRRMNERTTHPENLMNRIVFDSIEPSPYNQEAEEEYPPYYVPKSPSDYTLVFESRFESGNLRRAVQVYEFEYDLILKPDNNSRCTTQWYYFSVSNVQTGRMYRFNIINMIKPDSLYNYGMRPLMYSVNDAMLHNRGWVRCGSDICYFQNNIERKNSGFYYTLSFSINFNHNYDTVFFAYCYPYTYSDLCSYLNKITFDPLKKQRVLRETLCETVAGNPCEVLTITNFASDKESIKNRKGVVLTSRVHPGETNASWMMQGVIDYLTGPTLDAKILRDYFVFKVVPMLNPDGVINGWYRCGIPGMDLNRCWIGPCSKQNATIFHTKQLLKSFQEERDVAMFVDFHGHSMKKNIFMYGCCGRPQAKEKVFPKLVESCSEIFSFKGCDFGIQKAKEATGRVVVYRELGILNSFTLEASFCGADFGPHCNFHFTPEHLIEMGHNFCDALLEICDPEQVKVKQALEQLEIINTEDSEEAPIEMKSSKKIMRKGSSKLDKRKKQLIK